MLALAISAALVVAGVAGPLVLDDLGTPPAPPPLVVADVAVYGATASGVMAAVSAARHGASVVLLDPGRHIGGMVSGGLGRTDVERKDLVGGMTLEFYGRVGTVYEMSRFGQFVAWYHEPHVAAAIFSQMLSEAGVTVLLDQPLDRLSGVTKAGARIEEIRTLAGTTVRAATYVDGTYEGDLLAAAGVSYAVGRESRATYGEFLAGVQPVDPAQTGLEKVSGIAADTGQPVRGVSGAPLEPPGTADRRIQPFTFRLCITDVAGNRVPFEAPAGYSENQYALLARAIGTWTRRTGKAPALTSLLIVGPLPNGKADLNSARLYSTDLVGGSYDWPDANDATRDRIWDDHRDYVAGYLHFLRTSEAVPAALRQDIDRWGLCRDEFTDTGNWPPQLYVREARRMIGPEVLTQRDIQVDVRKPDSIGVAGYRIDSHNVRRVLDEGGFVRGEGYLEAPAGPYEIPLGILLPARLEAENLVVAVAVSASHVAWASLRMEPQLMTMGEAAGVVAAIAADGSRAVRDVPYRTVEAALRDRRAILDVP